MLRTHWLYLIYFGKVTKWKVFLFEEVSCQVFGNGIEAKRETGTGLFVWNKRMKREATIE